MNTKLKSEKGTTVIIMAIIVAGMIMLVISVAAENIRQSLKTQGNQKKALDQVYQAEEGVEYAYYITKNDVEFEGGHEEYIENAPFDISLWHKSGDDIEEVTGDNKDKIETMRDAVGEEYIIASESIESEDVSQAHKKTIFTKNPFITIEEEGEEEGG